MSVTDIQSMSRSEKLIAMEQLWDSLCRDKPEPDSPAWHADVLAEREEKQQKGEDEFVPWEEAKKHFGR